MITIKNLSFGYKKRVQLFDDLDLNLAPGNICGLLGKNGAGKTTLLKLMSGLLYPKKGQIDIMGHRPSDRSPLLLSDLYLIPEEFAVQPAKISTFQKLYAPFYPRFSEEQFYGYLREFEIDPVWKMTGLSYGQKKKVLISFGLATNCSLLILDEPTNGLDIPSKSQFRRLLAGAISDEKCFLISTHQVRDMSNLIDPVILVKNGKIVFHETVEAITSKLYFGTHFGLKAQTDALYTEQIPGGYLSVTPNTTGEESEVDLEVLFNAVVNNEEKIKELFKNVIQHEA